MDLDHSQSFEALLQRETRINAMRAVFRVSGASQAVVQRWLARHPDKIDAAALDIALVPPLSDLLWHELQEHERIFFPDAATQPVDDPVQYWVRRRRITQFHRWMRVVSQLPVCWHRIANASSDEIKKAASAIGSTAVSAASRGRSPDEIVRWLAPLGKELATRVITDAAAHPSKRLDRPVMVVWRGAYQSASEFFRGPDLLMRTGYLLMAAVYHHLSQAHRLALSRAARSTVFESLAQLSAIELPALAIKPCEDLIAGVFVGQIERTAASRASEVDSVELTFEQ